MTRNPALWLVGHEPLLRTRLRAGLEAQGFELRVLADIAAVPRRLVRERPDALLLAHAIADDAVFHCCDEIRGAGDDVPIVVLTAIHVLDDCVRAFDAGADDCVALACDPRELAARIRSLLRRRSALPSGAPLADAAVAFGDCELELSTRRLLRAGRQIVLTSGEFALLAALVRHAQRPLSRERLVELARGPGVATNGRSIDVQVSRLRKLIEPDPAHPRFLQTVWGHGYVFVPDIAAASVAAG